MQIMQAWGMTETSPLGAVARPPADAEGEEHWRYRHRDRPDRAARRGAPDGRRRRGPVGRRVDRRGRGPRPLDRVATTTRTRPAPTSSTTAGCARATSPRSTREGFMRITDRAKDLIKSGGEWISSVELENALMSHPDVLEAAVIAKPDERWTERPLACVVLPGGRRSHAGGAARAPRAAGREVVAAGRVRLHRGGPEDERRQVRQEGPARPARRGRARDGAGGGRSAREVERPPPLESRRLPLRQAPLAARLRAERSLDSMHATTRHGCRQAGISGRSASSWPSPASTVTTAGRRSSPARCVTPAWR